MLARCMHSYLVILACIGGVVCSPPQRDSIWSCRYLAERQDWGVPGCASARERQKVLSNCTEFLSYYTNCILLAISNDTSPMYSYENIRELSTYELPILDPDDFESTKAGVQKAAFQRPDKLRELIYVNATDPDELHAALETARWRQQGDDISFRCGLAIMLYWVAVYAISFTWGAYVALWSPNGRIVRWIRAKLIIPSLIPNVDSQSSIVRWAQKLGINQTSRILIVVVIGYAMLNFCLLFLCYPPSVEENFMFETSSLQYYKCMAVRGAFLTTWSLPLVTFFSGRNNLLHIFHGESLGHCLFLHKWLARIALIDGIVHAVAISIVKIKQGWYGLYWRVDYWQWGVAVIAVMGLTAVQSVSFLRRAKYEIFHFVHVSLAVTIAICTWYHVKKLPYGWEQVMVVAAIWGFDHAARGLRILLNGNVTAELVQINEELVSISFGNNWFRRRTAEMGSFAFFHFPVGPWGVLKVESHPFTPFTIASGQSMIYMRRKKGITDRLSGLNAPTSLSVWIDGPYGSRPPLERYDHVILIAAGVGVAPSLNYLPGLISGRPSNMRETDKTCRTVSLHWAVSASSYSSQVMEAIGRYKSFADIQIYVKEGSSHSEAVKKAWVPETSYKRRRLSCSEIVASKAEQVQGSIGVLVCGPRKLHEDARAAVCEAILKSSHYIGFFEEASGW